jgi:IS5 family transposase
MNRNWLKGAIGDAMHAVLCACGYNLRLLLHHLALLLAKIWVVILASKLMMRPPQITVAA